MRVIIKELIGEKSRGLRVYLMDGYNYYYSFKQMCINENSETNLIEVVKRK